jgi:hypothetical protein
MAISLVPIPVGLDFTNADVLGMVFAQPHLTITPGHPFKIVEARREAAAAIFRNSLQYAFQTPEGMPRVHFAIFPEFTLPFESFSVAEEMLASTACPSNTVVIAGLEWLTAGQYIELLASSANPTAIKAKHPDPHFFVNCCAIWIKTNDQLLRFLQPKLRPSPPEAATQVMYRGQDVFVFATPRPTALSFSLLICFDCIAAAGEKNMFDQILEAAPDTGLNTSFNLQMLFVPQYNDSPEHASFLDFADRFLNRGGATLNTADSAVAFVNSASHKHGRADGGYGRSSVFYRAGRWQSIPADGPLVRVPGTYAVEGLNSSLMRARFREDGPSLHRFGFVLPWRVTREAGASRIPLTEAIVAKFNDEGDLGVPRYTAPISKVFTDWWTDDLAESDPRFGSTVDVIPEYSAVRQHVNAVADSDPERVGQVVDLLLLGFDAPCSRPKLNPDAWQLPIPLWRRDDHGQAIVELAAACSLLALIGEIGMGQESQVRTGTCGELQFVLLDGNAQRSHVYLIQKYFEWLDTHPWGEIAGKKVVIILSRSSVVYLNTANNVAEEIQLHVGALSAQDETALTAINPDLSTQPGAITEDGTRFFKHFRSILAESLNQPAKLDAVNFLKERLGQAI